MWTFLSQPHKSTLLGCQKNMLGSSFDRARERNRTQCQSSVYRLHTGRKQSTLSLLL